MTLSYEQRKATAKARADQRKRNEAAVKDAEAQRRASAEFAALPRHEQRRAELALRAKQEERNAAVKAASGAPENKALKGPGENKAEPVDVASLSKDELEALAVERGVKVKGTGKGGNVLKADLVKALGG